MNCRHVREWLHRDAASLDEAQRLQLDDHLASCESCRGDRERMLTLYRAGSSLDALSSDARMYDRAIARAQLAGPRAAEPVRARWMWPLALGALAATAMAAVIALRSSGTPNTGVASRGSNIETIPSRAPDATVPAPDAVESQLQVVIGSNAIMGGASIARDDMPIEAATSRPRPHDDVRSKPEPASTEPIADILARARRLLAAKRYAEAERTALSVFLRAKGADEAEARTILADVALALGQAEYARTRYLEIANKFASLPAGESALYAAARVDVRRGRDARALLEKYLDRYPRGRFVDDARRLLDASPEEKR